MINLNFIKNQVKILLQIEILNIVPINEGVMNFTFLIKTKSEDFIIKLNPKGRDEIALKEFKVINLCQSKNIKVPIILHHHSAKNENDYSFILYKKLPGASFSSCYNTLSSKSRISLIQEVYEELGGISSIILGGAGESNDLVNFSNSNWHGFLNDVAAKSFDYFNTNDIFTLDQIMRLRKFVDKSILTTNAEKTNLVWSDLDPSNIIVNENGKLSGFIDFEGILGGDPNLAIGYLYAKTGPSDLFKRLVNDADVSYNQIEFYAIMRYLRLIVYSKYPLPTGIKRDNINDFLPYSYELVNKII